MQEAGQAACLIKKEKYMNSDEISLITGKKYYLILSAKTNQAYIDKDGAGYLFAIKREAESYVNALGHSKVYITGKSQTITQNKDIRAFICLGMKSLNIKRRDKDVPDVIVFRRADIRKGYYNTDLEFNVTRLRQTSMLKYLLAMKENTFLVPVYIAPREEKKYPKLYYCHAVFKDKHEALVVFSMMEEFDTWNKTMIHDKGKEFFPLEISATRVLKARNGADVIINPLSDKLYLTAEQLQK